RVMPATIAIANHEYRFGRREHAEENVVRRFPLLGRQHWYTVTFGPVLLVILDSNEDSLRAAEWERQGIWYAETLEKADAAIEIRGVFVLLHHPPFTNSTVTGDERHVQRAFLPAFLGARKTLAMLCGHVHSYERFLRGGKMLVVSGGGGGPRHPLATGQDRRHDDDLFAGPPVRDFHFTVYTVNEKGVDAEVRGLKK